MQSNKVVKNYNTLPEEIKHATIIKLSELNLKNLYRIDNLKLFSLINTLYIPF